MEKTTRRAKPLLWPAEPEGIRVATGLPHDTTPTALPVVFENLVLHSLGSARAWTPTATAAHALGQCLSTSLLVPCIFTGSGHGLRRGL